MQTTDHIIELRNVSKYFDDVCALSNVDLSIANGEFLTLLGPSGCGKTTILRLISGFEKPTTGHVFINGRQVNDLPPEKRQGARSSPSYRGSCPTAYRSWYRTASG